MPRDAPVTKAIFPSNRPIFVVPRIVRTLMSWIYAAVHQASTVAIRLGN